MNTDKLVALVLLIFLVSIRITAVEAAGEPSLDVLDFGDTASESAHDLNEETSQFIEGKDDTSARQISTPQPGSLGSMSVTMECHPSKRTYLTVKVPSDVEDVRNPVILDAEDNIIKTGKFHVWERGVIPVPVIRKGAKHSEWVYYTRRLPKYMTEGKNRVDIRFVLPAGSTPSYPFHSAYTHTDPLFSLPAEEEDASADHESGTVGDSLDGEDYLSSLIGDINGNVRRFQQREERLSPKNTYFIALAYSHPDWFDAVDQKTILEKVKSAIDFYARKQAESSPKALWGPRAETGNNTTWHGHGTLAQAYSLLHDAFKEAGLLSETLADHPDGDIPRREAYTDFFDEALAWRCQVRNITWYNQCVIVSNGLVRMSRALNILNPQRAPDRETVNRWIDEAIGLAPMSPYIEGPFHGDDSLARKLQGKNYSEESVPGESWRHGRGKRARTGTLFMATEAGTPKERGRYAMSYGMVGLRHTADMARETGLQRVKDRVVDMVRAREAMTWWVKDAETENRRAAAGGTFGARAKTHPGNPGAVGYGGLPLVNWLAAPHEVTKRWAELLFEHKCKPRLFPRIRHQKILWVEAYRAFQEEKPSDYVVPLNRKRYVWSDEELGLVTVIDGDTHMKMQLGYSGSPLRGVSGAARVHYHGPGGDRVLTIDLDRMDFPFTGQTWKQGEKTYFDGSKVLWRDEPTTIEQALAGTEHKFASQPDGEPWLGPDYRRGLGIHYRQLRVGPYLIGMNSTGAEERGFGPGKEYDMEVPAEAVDVRTGEEIDDGTITVPPRTTKVFKLHTENAKMKEERK